MLFLFSFVLLLLEYITKKDQKDDNIKQTRTKKILNSLLHPHTRPHTPPQLNLMLTVLGSSRERGLAQAMASRLPSPRLLRMPCAYQRHPHRCRNSARRAGRRCSPCVHTCRWPQCLKYEQRDPRNMRGTPSLTHVPIHDTASWPIQGGVLQAPLLLPTRVHATPSHDLRLSRSCMRRDDQREFPAHSTYLASG
jgi:hypothetical protein